MLDHSKKERTIGQALEQQLSEIREQNEQVALVVCGMIETFRGSESVSDLEDIKNFVRLGLQDALDHVRTYERRDRRRRPHFDRRMARNSSLKRQFNRHVELLKTRTMLYQDRRLLLRSAADAVIWILLKEDIRQIARLYKEGRHELPTDIGLAGVIQLQAKLHATGHFLAMENDLTRCAGLGDLTVVRLDGKQLAPLMLEVKTRDPRVPLREGIEIEVLTLTASSGYPADQEALQLLTEAIGKEMDNELPVTEDAERQGGEIAERTRMISEALTSGATPIRAPSRNWRTLAAVADRATRDGMSLDVAERGVFYYAVRADTLQQTRARLHDVHARVRIFTQEKLSHGATHELLGHAQVSGIVLPIPLWPLPIRTRAALLAGSLLIGAFVEESLFKRLFQNRGATLEVESDGTWCIRKGESVARLDPLFVRAVQVGAVVGGVSPQSLVANLVSSLAST